MLTGCKTMLENQTNAKKSSFPYLVLIIVILIVIIVATIATTVSCYVIRRKRSKKKRTGSTISTEEKFYLKPLKDREGLNDLH